ncbi:CoA transferase [Prauserella rugosa]|uniref:CoA transferase n=1 Tax=Prauserella rugosa TaxID=43354 RepID=UPI000B1F4F3E|nr:CoA transferase [Prauserella rugosa]
MADIDELERVVAAWTSSLTTEELSARLEEAGIPFGPILSIEDAAEHPQLRARDMVVDTPHTALGSVTHIGLPVKLSASPGRIRRSAPRVGEHTAEILTELLGITPDQLDHLRAAGAV